MNIGELLQQLALLSMLISIATENINSLAKPFFNLSQYKLVMAFAWTTIGVIGLNVGMMDLLGMITESSLSWIHYFDLGLTIAFFTSGAQAVHKLTDMVSEYIGKKQ